MNKTAMLFAIAFIVGAAATLGFRTIRHRPYDAQRAAPQGMAPLPTASQAAVAPPVNTVCAICGMDVDPALPTAQYRGKTIGFGCAGCPPKFASEPEAYGPYALKNEEAP